MQLIAIASVRNRHLLDLECGELRHRIALKNVMPATPEDSSSPHESHCTQSYRVCGHVCIEGESPTFFSTSEYPSGSSRSFLIDGAISMQLVGLHKSKISTSCEDRWCTVLEVFKQG